MKDRIGDMLGRSLIYMRKSMGPRLDPCGTPYFTLLRPERAHYRRHIGGDYQDSY